MTLETPNVDLSSVASIVAASFVVTEVAKRYISEKTPVVGKIPVLLFPLVISAVLAVLSNKVFKDNTGKPFLQGNIWTLLISTVVSATSASGVFTWFKNGSQTIGNAQPLGTKPNGEDNTMKPTPIIAAICLMFLGGCAVCPEKIALRETMDTETTSIRQDHKAWAAALVAYPVGTTDPRTGQPSTGKPTTLPTLTPAQYNQMMATHAEYEGTVADDRSHDGGTK